MIKKLLTLLLLIPNLVLALPPCPSGDDIWDNCHGKYTYDKGEVYVGDWKNDKRNGYGKITFPDGTVYVGDWKNDERNGYGTENYDSGDVYVGEHKDDFREGQGKYTFLDGNEYIGEFKKGQFDGQGTFIIPNVEKYIGEFKKNQYDGQGKITFPSGEEYVGEFKKNQYDGQGTFIIPNVEKYIGEFKKDQYDGQGKITFPDGEEYVGEFKKDQYDGQGKMTLSNGEKYEGQWKLGSIHGKGTYFYSNGDKYIGDNEYGEAHGQGTYIFANGEKRSGNWINGEFDKTKIADVGGDSNPNIQPKKKELEDVNQNSDDKKLLPAASGTGFAVSENGYVLTNDHVINGCQALKIHTKDKIVSAKIISRDSLNDLALIKANFKPKTVFVLRNEAPNLLDEIFVAGYPFGYQVSNSIKITSGIVSSLSGIGNNFSNMQIDAAIQPGNSGGPVIDKQGNVIGIAVAKLDFESVYKDYGVVPENTNFAIKASVARNFIESNDVYLSKRNTSKKRNLGKYISNGTFYISCMMTTAKIKEMQTEKVFFQNTIK
jgi:hypothetical protein